MKKIKTIFSSLCRTQKRRVLTGLSGLMLLHFAAKAQLSGNYTIGGTTPDYASISAAVNDLYTQGVNGAVVFKLRNGTYNEQIQLVGPVSGSSLINTIAFESESGNPSDVSIENPSASYNCMLDSVPYIQLRYLTFSTSASASFAQILLNSRVDGVKINGCVFDHQAIQGSNTVYDIYRFELNNGWFTDSIFITNNKFYNGGNAIYMFQQFLRYTRYVDISNNDFTDCNYHALYLVNVGRAYDAIGNSLGEIGKTRVTANRIVKKGSSSCFFNTVYLSDCLKEIDFHENYIEVASTNVNTNAAMVELSNNGNGNTTYDYHFYNNIVLGDFSGATSNAFMMKVTNGARHKFYHNTFITMAGNATTSVFAFSGGNESNTFQNNIFQSYGSAGNSSIFNIWDSGFGNLAFNVQKFQASDYNIYFSTGKFAVNKDMTVVYNDFSEWKDSTVFDDNSYIKTQAVHFNLTAQPTLCSGLVADGMNIPLVTDDFLGNSRPATPSRGALEGGVAQVPLLQLTATVASGCELIPATELKGITNNWPVFHGSVVWSAGGNVIGTDSVLNLSNVTSGNYYVFSYSYGDCESADSLLLQVYALPSVSVSAVIDSICLNDAVLNVSVNPGGGVLSGNGVSGYTFDPFVAGVGLQQLAYSYSDSNNCINADTLVIEVLACTFEDEKEETEMFVYPNPSGTFINIRHPATISSVRIFNHLGQEVKRCSAINHSIETTTLERGSYVMKFYEGDVFKGSRSFIKL